MYVCMYARINEGATDISTVQQLFGEEYKLLYTYSTYPSPHTHIYN